MNELEEAITQIRHHIDSLGYSDKEWEIEPYSKLFKALKAIRLITEIVNDEEP